MTKPFDMEIRDAEEIRITDCDVPDLFGNRYAVDLACYGFDPSNLTVQYRYQNNTNGMWRPGREVLLRSHRLSVAIPGKFRVVATMEVGKLEFDDGRTISTGLHIPGISLNGGVYVDTSPRSEGVDIESYVDRKDIRFTLPATFDNRGLPTTQILAELTFYPEHLKITRTKDDEQ